VLDVLARANVAMAPVRRRRPMLTPGKVRELSNPDWVCDNAALTAATGWAPRIDLDEGIRRTLGRP
jgi:nucleoside-diphosphate-sugar epimerase